MSWYDYVKAVVPDVPKKEIAAASGVDSSTVSRWSSGLAPKPEDVAAFTRAYKRPVLEAFVAAGFLTEEEAGVQPVARLDLSKVEVRRLLREVQERYEALEQAVAAAEVSSRDFYRFAARAGHPENCT